MPSCMRIVLQGKIITIINFMDELFIINDFTDTIIDAFVYSILHNN